MWNVTYKESEDYLEIANFIKSSFWLQYLMEMPRYVQLKQDPLQIMF